MPKRITYYYKAYRFLPVKYTKKTGRIYDVQGKIHLYNVAVQLKGGSVGDSCNTE